MNVGLKATGQYIKGNFVQKDTVKVTHACLMASCELLASIQHAPLGGGSGLTGGGAGQLAKRQAGV